METVHVRSLEKYHPGYRDRTLTWAKIFVNMAMGDPDCELLNEVDWSRLIRIILLELRARKPLPNVDTYWRMHGFDLQNRPMSLTLQMLHNFVVIGSDTCDVPLRTSSEERNIEKRREEKIREYKEQPKTTAANCAKPVENFSTAFIEKAAIASKRGFNVYMLINRFYKQSKLSERLPEAVFMEVLDSFLIKEDVKEAWPYFIKVLKEKSRAYFAHRSVEEHQKFKGEAMSISQIFQSLSKTYQPANIA